MQSTTNRLGIGFLTSDRVTVGNTDFYASTQTGGVWGTPVILPNFNSTGGEIGAYLTTDALTMIYGFIPVGQTFGDIYVASRANTATAFQAGAAVANVNDASDDADVQVIGDGSVIYFSSSRSGTSHVYQATKGAGGAFGTPTIITPITSSVYDAHPRVSPDGLTLYYSSMRTDGGAQGGADIWVSKRPTTATSCSRRTAPAALATRTSTKRASRCSNPRLALLCA